MNIGIVPDRTRTVNSPAPIAAPEDGSRSEGENEEAQLTIYQRNGARATTNLDAANHAWPLPAGATVLQEIAFGLGQGDAQEGWLAVPENYFTRRDLQVYYCRGYVSVAGPTLGTQYFLKGVRGMDINAVFPSKYLRAEDLKGKEVTVTIQEMQMIKMGHGSEKEDKPVLWFVKATKGLILNRTNALAISALYGSETNDWKGKRITLVADRVKAFGDWHDVVRVKEQAPALVVAQQAAPAPTPEPAAPPQTLDDDVDFSRQDEGEEEPGDGDDVWDELSPPQARLLDCARITFGKDWDMAEAWMVRRWSKQVNPDHVIDDVTLLTDDECDMLADYIVKNDPVLRQTWPQQKQVLLHPTQ